MPWEYETEDLHGSEVRTLTVTLAVGSFAYTLLEACNSAGSPKSIFAKGATVYANIKGINNGEGEASATIVVKDVDTGSTIKTITTGVMDSGEVFEIRAVAIGTMPDRDWTLEFSMTP